jgi:plasmid stability protein
VRNVTVALDDETAGWARVEAARRDQSLSAFLRDLLRREMERDRRLSEAAASYRSRPARHLSRAGTTYPRRDEVHAR